ncbi:MAG: alpha/beta hydrolase [Propionibacteriaceae bacterium]|jgi:pimeloyl-ACP methyl ester carboxylesterase|nr:alpha/beta hydrolase [Propionibacteriaceae bacterium]
MSYSEVDGVRLYNQVLNPKGSPTVVMVHGLYTHHGIFFWCGARELAQLGYKVVLYDLRGHGFSKGRADGFRLRDMAHDLIGLLDALGIDQVFLVGYSFGGAIVVETALEAPNRVLGVALLEAAGLKSSSLVEVDDVDQKITETLAGYSESIGMKLPARSAKQFRDTVHSLLDAGLLADARADADFFWNAPLETMTRPALLVYGQSSPYIEDGHAAAARLPHSQLLLLEGDHNMVVRQGDAIAQRLVEFSATMVVDSSVQPASGPEASEAR